MGCFDFIFKGWAPDEPKLKLKLIAEYRGATKYRFGSCEVIKSQDNGRLHLSIWHASRYPTWHECKKMVNKLADKNKAMVMVLEPKKSKRYGRRKYYFEFFELKKTEI